MNTQLAGVEAPVSKADVPWLVGTVLSGGVAAPMVLLFSLRNTPAATASLLLNFEGVATTLIAALIFREAIGRRIWWAIACVTAASILLSWDVSGEWGISVGAVGVLGACILWGIDNNLTRNISAKDPISIITIKGLGAGSFALILALITRNPFPGPVTALGAMLLGSVSYGLSIILFIFAMRSLGAARTSALFGTAPFVGTLLSFLIFGEAPSMLFLVSLPMMILGAVLLLGEQHAHQHSHTPFQHDHRHTHHDDHHLHEHSPGEIPPGGSHSHLHQHRAMEHSHPHAPDIHHRHQH